MENICWLPNADHRCTTSKMPLTTTDFLFSFLSISLLIVSVLSYDFTERGSNRRDGT